MKIRIVEIMKKLIEFILSLFGSQKKTSPTLIIDKVKSYNLTVDDLKRDNFKASEFYFSRTANENKIDNTPKDYQIIKNLARLADTCQSLHNYIQRKHKNKKIAINITSGYRNPIVNQLVKGDPMSVHKTGLAADFYVTVNNKFLPLLEVAKCVVESNIVFDQLLVEKKQNVVHLGLKVNPEDSRYEVSYAWTENGVWRTKLITNV